MNRCPGCSSEIPDGAPACATCGVPVGTLVPRVDDDATTALVLRRSPTADPNAAKATTIRRELLLAAAGAMAAAVVIFALLALRSGSSATLAAAPSETARANAPVKPVAPAKAAAVSGVTAVQKWSADNRKFWLGTARGAAFELLADNDVQTWFGPVRPVLVVRCASRTTETFVYTRSAVKIEPNAEGKTVTVSVDDEPVRTEHWSDSEDHVALFAPDGPALAERLIHARTLRFGYSPHNSSDVVAQFNVAGLAELMEPAARECRPKK